MADKPKTDWERIEAEFRAGQLSNREVAHLYGVSEGAIRKKAKACGWKKDLAEKVRAAVREKLVRGGTREREASDRELVEEKAEIGATVVRGHQKHIQELLEAKQILSARLRVLLDGGEPEGPCMGEKESPADLLEKLTRITAKLLPLDRQAHNLDEDTPPGAIILKLGSDDAAL